MYFKRLKTLREINNFSKQEISTYLNVNLTTYEKWETGKSKPSYKTMKLIDDFCKSNNIDFDISKELVKE